MSADRSRPFRGSSPGRVASLRRKTAWTDGPGGTSSAQVSTATPIFLGSAVQAAVEGLTVVRIRGYALVYLTVATSALDGFNGALGIGIASLAAVTAGIASVPTPITEAEAESWLWHEFFAVKGSAAFAAGAAPIGSSVQLATRIVIDSRGMRKLPSDLSLYASIEAAETGTAVMQVELNTRMLVKLP